jgi:indole-3-glycerol phosphate synthase
MNYLDKILLHKRSELAARKAAVPLPRVCAEAESSPNPLDFCAAVKRPPGLQPRLIAEVKCASPSRGLLTPNFDPIHLAEIYRTNGAAAISVLTDEHFFRGSLDHLRRIAALERRIPVLRKDFILEEYQLYEARAAGASAVLLIVAAMERARLRLLRELSKELGLAALIEVHSQAEVETALEAGARLIGINHRNLDTFEIDLKTSFKLRPQIPNEVTVVAESGIHTRADVDFLATVGVDAILVGEALVTALDIAATTRELAG